MRPSELWNCTDGGGTAGQLRHIHSFMGTRNLSTIAGTMNLGTATPVTNRQTRWGVRGCEPERHCELLLVHGPVRKQLERWQTFQEASIQALGQDVVNHRVGKRVPMNGGTPDSLRDMGSRSGVREDLRQRRQIAVEFRVTGQDGPELRLASRHQREMFVQSLDLLEHLLTLPLNAFDSIRRSRSTHDARRQPTECPPDNLHVSALIIASAL